VYRVFWFEDEQLDFFRLLCGVAIALGVEAGGTSAATTIYTDRAAFDLATGGGLNFEDFSDATFDDTTITTNAPGSVFLTGGQLRARPTPVALGGSNLQFAFNSPTTAFGGDFDLSPGGSGNGLRFVLDGNEIVSQEIGAPFTGFFGFVSDLSFSTVTVESGVGPGIAETHLIDNLSFGLAAPVAPIPLPAGLPLLLSGLLAFFGLRQWSRKTAVA
jgi:hypothetical protein